MNSTPPHPLIGEWVYENPPNTFIRYTFTADGQYTQYVMNWQTQHYLSTGFYVIDNDNLTLHEQTQLIGKSTPGGSPEYYDYSQVVPRKVVTQSYRWEITNEHDVIQVILTYRGGALPLTKQP